MLIKDIAWEIVLNSTWKTFETKFKPILESLKRHRTLLSDEKLTAAIAEIQDARNLATEGFKEQSAVTNGRFNELSQHFESRFQQLSEQLCINQKQLAEKEISEQQETSRQHKRMIAEKLGAPDYGGDQQRASQHRFLASGEWVIKHSNFVNWIDSQDALTSTLYMSGKPGAGKYERKVPSIVERKSESNSRKDGSGIANHRSRMVPCFRLRDSSTVLLLQKQ